MEQHTHDAPEQATAPGQHLPGERPLGNHSHLHGKPASWVLVAVIIAAFIAGAFAVVDEVWTLFWVCLAIVVLSVPAGKLVGIMGDTVVQGNPEAQAGQGGDVAEDSGSAAHPGVDMGPAPAVAIDQPAVPS